jgi:predicted ATP-grasp superfamily ATP-dependent carboligase
MNLNRPVLLQTRNHPGLMFAKVADRTTTDNEPASRRTPIRFGISSTPPSCTMNTNLLVIGASGRFLAESAARAGWRVGAIDLFNDHDLRNACCQNTRLAPGEYPAAIPALAAKLPPGPVVYAGGLENHPQVLAELAIHRQLAGNGPAVLHTIRQPSKLAALAAAAGWQYPETHATPAGLPTDGSFLCKPLASAGGHGITHWTEDRLQAPAAYWQRFVEGIPLSVSLLLGRKPPQLLGLCRQFNGLSWCHAAPFGFCGGVELPLPLPETPLRQSLEQLLQQINERTQLAGLVGVDFVLPRERGGHSPRPILIEMNPRPTATMELIERRTGISLVAAHLAAFGWQSPRPSPPQGDHGYWAKAILFAQNLVTVTSELDQQLRLTIDQTRAAEEAASPLLADRPVIGSQISPGSPILTVFASAATPTTTVRRLCHRARQLNKLLSSAATAGTRI